MKKRLIAAACAFIVLLAVITALLCAVIEKSDSGDYGRFAVTANEIEQLLKDVDAISKKFNSSLEQLHKDVYALGTKLNTSASSLLNLHTDLTGIESHSVEFDSDIPEDAVRVEKADDDSGLTIISYAPNTDFNEDLNIQPDSTFDFGKREG